MKYYTKEWYELMQRQHYTSGLHKIPDKTYSDQEIQAFYDADLAAEVAHDEMLYNTPPNYDLYESLLAPARFQPHIFLFVNEETGEATTVKTKPVWDVSIVTLIVCALFIVYFFVPTVL